MLRLIAGLGNPGKDYAYTRHNLGFLVIRRLAEKLNLKFVMSSRAKAMSAEGAYEGQEICLLAPLTYMNNSGVAVSQFMAKKEVLPEDLLVICDDFHLDFEQIRIRAKGSDGGHNGLSSVVQHLGTDRFPRLRMGIGYPPGHQESVDYVLEEFSKEEKDRLDGFVEDTVACSLLWLTGGVQAAMDCYNGRNKPEA